MLRLFACLLKYSQQGWMQENHAKVMTVFRQFDRNGDGQISAKEFENGCAKLGLPATPEDITVCHHHHRGHHYMAFSRLFQSDV